EIQIRNCGDSHCGAQDDRYEERNQRTTASDATQPIPLLLTPRGYRPLHRSTYNAALHEPPTTMPSKRRSFRACDTPNVTHARCHTLRVALDDHHQTDTAPAAAASASGRRSGVLRRCLRSQLLEPLARRSQPWIPFCPTG